MTYLKINNNKGFFRVDSSKDDWYEIDQIGKDDLLKLLNIATTQDFSMDEYKDELLMNPAHNIIYRNIYSKFSELLSNRTRFQDSVNSMYKSAIDKYTFELSQEENKEQNASD
ncbi:hypothetical protein [uncultured Marivirga sp.]|uniref:hypothetical protein n=1 Tax=uncultured Marivirga sp. TaxID=1123707 RepID=UPI0030EEE118|tara:strand:+ start:22924 stop:23262 length:339 start_codon:yes stop_codon:yes gene_type:complete